MRAGIITISISIRMPNEEIAEKLPLPVRALPHLGLGGDG